MIGKTTDGKEDNKNISKAKIERTTSRNNMKRET